VKFRDFVIFVTTLGLGSCAVARAQVVIGGAGSAIGGYTYRGISASGGRGTVYQPMVRQPGLSRYSSRSRRYPVDYGVAGNYRTSTRLGPSHIDYYDGLGSGYAYDDGNLWRPYSYGRARTQVRSSPLKRPSGLERFNAAIAKQQESRENRLTDRLTRNRDFPQALTNAPDGQSTGTAAGSAKENQTTGRPLSELEATGSKENLPIDPNGKPRGRYLKDPRPNWRNNERPSTKRDLGMPRRLAPLTSDGAKAASEADPESPIDEKMDGVGLENRDARRATVPAGSSQNRQATKLLPIER
jgi:hypothetical protein